MRFLAYLKARLNTTTDLSFTLFKIMVPVIIVIKILEELGFITILSSALEPIMELVGLPGSMGLVWATAMITNLYAGIVVFASLASETPMTIAQATIVSSMMLIAHGLPVEVRVAQKVGVRVGFSLVLRISMAILLGLLLNYIYSYGNWLQEPVELLWTPEISNPNILEWAFDQIINLVLIYIIVFALVIVLDVLERLNIIQAITYTIRPALKLMGIGKDAETITLVGLSLGLSYGGALMIKEVEKGHITKKEVLFSVSLLSLSHSLIEDTLLMMLISAHLSGILLARVIFSFIIIYLLVLFVNRLTEATIDRFFSHSP